MPRSSRSTPSSLPACRCAVRYTVHKYTFDRASQLELGPQGDKQPIPQYRDDAPTAQHANQSQGNMRVARAVAFVRVALPCSGTAGG